MQNLYQQALVVILLGLDYMTTLKKQFSGDGEIPNACVVEESLASLLHQSVSQSLLETAVNDG